MSVPAPDPSTNPDAVQAAAALERALSQVTTDAQAEQIIRDLQRLADSRTVADETGGAAAAIARASQAAPAGQHAAALIAATARRLAAVPPQEADALDEAILRVTAPNTLGIARGELRTSRRALRRAVIRGLGPLYAVDTAVFLDINQLPHPRWMNAAMRFVTIVMKGANALSLGLLVAAVCQPRKGARVLAETLPPLWLSTFVVEVPVKRFFRRRRPFIEVVRATVIGRRPSSFSFPFRPQRGGVRGGGAAAPAVSALGLGVLRAGAGGGILADLPRRALSDRRADGGGGRDVPRRERWSRVAQAGAGSGRGAVSGAVRAAVDVPIERRSRRRHRGRDGSPSRPILSALVDVPTQARLSQKSLGRLGEPSLPR